MPLGSVAGSLALFMSARVALKRMSAVKEVMVKKVLNKTIIVMRKCRKRPVTKFFFQKSQKFGKFEKKLNPGSEKIECDA